MDKATRERLKQQAAAAKATTPAVEAASPPSAVLVKTPKVPTQRKCCATQSGLANPHADDCVQRPENRKPSQEKLKRQDRLPDGATFTGTYIAAQSSWSIRLTVMIDGEEQVFTRSGSNHDKLFHQLAAECRKWAAKKLAPAVLASQGA